MPGGPAAKPCRTPAGASRTQLRRTQRALTLGRVRKSTLLIGDGPPPNEAAAHTHGLLTRDHTSAADLVAGAEEDLDRYDTDPAGLPVRLTCTASSSARRESPELRHWANAVDPTVAISRGSTGPPDAIHRILGGWAEDYGCYVLGDVLVRR